MRRLLAVAIVLAIATSARAAPNVAQNTQKGSLLVFPDINVRDHVSTIIRIQNDQTRSVWVRCFYLDKENRRNDFTIFITRGQPIWFDAYSGAGTVGANPFPGQAGAGMLACFAVNQDETTQIRWNHLSGTATVMDYERGTAYEYSAWAFYANGGAIEGAPVSYWQDPLLGPADPAAELFTLPAPCDPAGDVDCTPTPDEGAEVVALDGTRYDKCPATLIGQFSPEGAIIGDEEATQARVEFGQTRVVFVGCNLDLRQQFQRYETKLAFEVWNENEVKLTGAHDCAGVWHETFLTDVKQEGDNFTLEDMKTKMGRYRVTPIKDDLICAPRKTTRVGIIGIQVTDVTTRGAEAQTGTQLTAVGSQAGFVVWDIAALVEEGKIR